MGDIVFDNVTLRHDRADVLSGVSFTIRAGTFCAILGPSGVGKSTVADLLVRLLDPDSGTVSLDGHDVRDLRHQGSSRSHRPGGSVALSVQRDHRRKHRLRATQRHPRRKSNTPEPPPGSTN